jgi:hypothetical protein
MHYENNLHALQKENNLHALQKENNLHALQKENLEYFYKIYKNI